MKLLAATAATAYVVGAICHLVRPTFPAYEQWGVACETGNSSLGDMTLTDLQEPVSTFTSLTLFVAVFSTPVALFGAVLAFGSGYLHAYQRDCAHNLDHAVASAAPAVVALATEAGIGGAVLLAALWVHYDPNIGFRILSYDGPTACIFVLGLVLVVGRIGARHFHYGETVDGPAAFAGLLSVAVAVCIKELNGDRNSHICTNNRQGAYADDARHGAWHVNAAVAMWCGTRLVMRTKTGMRAFWLAAAAALPPLAASLINFYKELVGVWVGATLSSSLLLCLVAFWPARAATGNTAMGTPLINP